MDAEPERMENNLTQVPTMHPEQLVTRCVTI